MRFPFFIKIKELTIAVSVMVLFPVSLFEKLGNEEGQILELFLGSQTAISGEQIESGH